MRVKENRKHAFWLVFSLGFGTDEPQSLPAYFESFELVDEDVAKTPQTIDKWFIEKEFKGVAQNLKDIDEIINECTEGWGVERLSRVDLAILRLAVYEMSYEQKIPIGVSVNEAVELAKRFSTDDSPGFVHSALTKAEEKYFGKKPKTDE